MIDRKKLFAALTHLTLSSEEILRRSFVCDEPIERHIAQRVKASGVLSVATNQPATLSWICFTGVGQKLVAV
jgi:hypothetical protein